MVWGLWVGVIGVIDIIHQFLQPTQGGKTMDIGTGEWSSANGHGQEHTYEVIFLR